MGPLWFPERRPLAVTIHFRRSLSGRFPAACTFLLCFLLAAHFQHLSTAIRISASPVPCSKSNVAVGGAWKLLPRQTMDDPKEPSQSPDHRDDKTSRDPETTTEQQPVTDNNAAEMAPGSKQRAPQPKREADLSSLLNSSEKTELTALINRLTDSMQNHVSQLCDSSTADDKPHPSRIALWSKLPSYLKDLSLTNPNNPSNDGQKRRNQKENAKPSRPKKPDRAGGKPGAVAKASLAPDPAPSQEGNNVIPQLQELKKEALQHFKKWQTAVHRRINDISVKKAPDVQTGQPSSSARKRASGSQRKNRSRRTSEVYPTPGISGSSG